VFVLSLAVRLLYINRPIISFLFYLCCWSRVFVAWLVPVKPKLTARFCPLPICFFTSCTSCLRVAFRRIFFSRCPFLCSRVDLGFVCLGLILAATAGICFAVRVFPPAGALSAASHAGSARLHSSACLQILLVAAHARLVFDPLTPVTVQGHGFVFICCY
jgi:hypothetical protein